MRTADSSSRGINAGDDKVAACTGFSQNFGPDVAIGSGLRVQGSQSAIANVNPGCSCQRDIGYTSIASAPKSHLLTIDWWVALPF